MDKNAVGEIFDSLFKFKVNEEVRHRGDTKGGMMADMGMLVMSRAIYETVTDDGERVFERVYVCRLLRWSGSGTREQFNEKELLSMAEWNDHTLDQEQAREELRKHRDQRRFEVAKLFGAGLNDTVFLKNPDGSVDRSRSLRVCGWKTKEKRIVLKLREVWDSTDKDLDGEEVEVTSASQIEKYVPEMPRTT